MSGKRSPYSGGMSSKSLLHIIITYRLRCLIAPFFDSREQGSVHTQTFGAPDSRSHIYCLAHQLEGMKSPRRYGLPFSGSRNHSRQQVGIGSMQLYSPIRDVFLGSVNLFRVPGFRGSGLERHNRSPLVHRAKRSAIQGLVERRALLLYSLLTDLWIKPCGVNSYFPALSILYSKVMQYVVIMPTQVHTRGCQLSGNPS